MLGLIEVVVATLFLLRSKPVYLDLPELEALHLLTHLGFRLLPFMSTASSKLTYCSTSYVSGVDRQPVLSNDAVVLRFPVADSKQPYQ